MYLPTYVSILNKFSTCWLSLSCKIDRVYDSLKFMRHVHIFIIRISANRSYNYENDIYSTFISTQLIVIQSLLAVTHTCRAIIDFVRTPASRRSGESA